MKKKKFFYARLALMNIRKNAKLFVPYVLTSIGTVMMFYIMMFIATNDGLVKMPGSEAITTIMALGSIVIGIFAVVILLYTNSFLMKRRKKEIGLYNILGMEKKHIAKIMFYESFFVAVFSIIVGLLLGILFSKLILLLLVKMLGFAVPFGFQVSAPSLITCIVLFASIFLLTLLVNLKQVHFAKPVELLYGGNVGEKEPKTKWITAIFGLLCLAAGYTIAIVVKNPLMALGWFFIAVILVILGTYLLFLAGSIAFLKLLRKNKKFYYQTKHFTSVSGMLYRMKQNAVGLANICVLSTMVLVMVSTTVSMFFGLEDGLRVLYPRNIQVEASELTPQQRQTVIDVVDKQLEGVEVSGKVGYAYADAVYTHNENDFIPSSDTAFGGNVAYVTFIPLDAFNKTEGTSYQLSDDEIVVFAQAGKVYSDTMTFGGKTFKVVAVLEKSVLPDAMLSRYADVYFIAMPSEQSILDLKQTGGFNRPDGELSYTSSFDVSGTNQSVLNDNIYEAVNAAVDGENHIRVTCAEDNRAQFLSLYGGFFFLGIFLGLLFIMATVVIMYYKQISEGYDDKERFTIMQKVGMSKAEVKKSIRSQVLTVFFLPLIVAGVHVLAAFKMITRLLAIMNMTNVGLFAIGSVITFVAFAIIYAVIYSLTARAYYKIVE